MKKRYGESYYADIALKAQEAWVRNGRKPRGFAANPELARIAGTKGGLRKKPIVDEDNTNETS
jgi:hypothetical protein